MTKIIIAIITSTLASSGFFSLIMFLINRKDSQKTAIEEIDKKLDSVISDQKAQLVDLTRTQLLLLISSYPNRHEEILKAAHKYFIDLGGNWIMETLFEDWLAEANVKTPSWYIKK